MATWLHFVGRKYYTQNSFAAEAGKQGITRRVSLDVLKGMEWGDRVLLAMWNGKKTLVFGSYFIDRVSGLSREAYDGIRKAFKSLPVDTGGLLVVRGCGSYNTGPCSDTEATIEQIARLLELLQKDDVPIGKPMVGGRFRKHQLVRLTNIPFRQGFREFDHETFRASVKKAPVKPKGTPAVKGQFYVEGAKKGVFESLIPCQELPGVKDTYKIPSAAYALAPTNGGNTWLHFVGKTVPSRESYAEDARKICPCERVSLDVLKKMAWGDRVVLAMWDGKTSIVFGSYPLRLISGLASEAARETAKKFRAKRVAPGGSQLMRGSQAYKIGPSYETDVAIERIGDFLAEEAKISIGKLMIGGTFQKHELVCLQDVPFRPGFRKIDYEAFASCPKKLTMPKEIPVAEGQFLAKPIMRGQIQVVANYRQKK